MFFFLMPQDVAAAVCVAVSDLLVFAPPTLGLLVALARGFGGRMNVEPGERRELHGRQRVWENSLWKDLYFGLSDTDERHKERA